MVRIVFFGKLADIAGGRCRDWPLGGGKQTVGDLIAAVGANDRALTAALNEKSVRFIVNEVVATRDAAVSDGDEIAFLPPVSGG